MYDVAVVGYGPAGQVAAGLLGQAGLKVYACDRLPGVYEIPRAISLDHEIMRVFQQLGVADAVAPFCEPFTPSEYYGVDGDLIRRMTMLPPPHPQGYTPSLVFTQPQVERVLRERIAQMANVTVQLGVEMQGIAQDAAGVRLEMGDGSVVQARYAIACDGGGSTVRTQLGMPLEDLAFDEPWLVVDVLVNERGLAKLPKVSVQYCEPERPCTLVIGPKNHRRWEISLNPGEDPRAAATPEATWRHLARWLAPEDGTLWRQASYRFHALVASQWRAGRVFLAGDAAHMQPPFLGQGMCQGIRDAANLSWKLAAVLHGEVKGEAAQALLDSYGTERKAHVRELTSRIKAVGAVICERDPAKARARDARMLAECGGTVQDTPRQDVLPPLEHGLLSRHAHAARGRLFPQPRIEGPRRMDEAYGNGWRLVLAPADSRHSREGGNPGLPDVLGPRLRGDDEGCGMRVRVLRTDEMHETDGVLAAWFHKNEVAAALVRPDNYVFGVAPGADDVRALVDEAASALGFLEVIA